MASSVPAGLPRGGRHFRGGPVEKPKNMGKTLKKLWAYVGVHRIKLFMVIFFVIASTLINLRGTSMIGTAIDTYILPGDFYGLRRMLIRLLAVYALSAFFSWAQLQLSVNLAQHTVADIRRDLFEKLQSLPLKFFFTTPRGDIMSRITNDVDTISNALNVSITQFISSVVTIVGIVGFMLYLSPLLTLVVVIIVPILLTATKFITKHSRVYFKQQQKALGELNGIVEENITGQKVIKVFVKEEDIKKKLSVSNAELRDVGVKAQVISGVMGPVATFINSIGYGFVAVMGALFNIPLGTITSFLLYSRQFARPFSEIAQLFNSLLSAVAGAERIFDVMAVEPEPADRENAAELTDIKGRVDFKGVNFSYVEGTPILKNIDLYAKPGQTIALVGPTGAGKTTVINLLTRFYDIQKGSITIDGTDIMDIKMSSLRRSLGIVLQDTYLFTGTIYDNIAYGRPGATEAQVKRAAMLANAHEFIRRLPQGYDTVLSEDSDTISQGQKQMLAIARTILADPAILILDEATSNVDTRTEVKIQQAMLTLMKGRTSFVIAHRLSTIRNANLIAVIKDGEIIERGDHRELMAQKGFYYNLYMNQFAV
ncbi:MAG: ABC transporter ATP-binding protein [Firmicutes bacterium]|nr:ABC transporter ATP-binding protein [Bacillota bacterium]